MPIIEDYLKRPEVDIKKLDPNPPYWIVEPRSRPHMRLSALFVRGRELKNLRHDTVAIAGLKRRLREEILVDDEHNIHFDNALMSEEEYRNCSDVDWIMHMNCPNITVDYIDAGWRFISKKMAEVIDDPTIESLLEEIRYIHATPNILDQEYRMLYRLDSLFSDVLDLEKTVMYKSPGSFVGFYQIPEPVFDPNKKPATPLFKMKQFTKLWATNEFAARALEAGLTGIVFRHPATLVVRSYQDEVIKYPGGLAWHTPASRKKFYIAKP